MMAAMFFHEMINNQDLKDTGMRDEVITALEKLEDAGLFERTGENAMG